MGSRLGPMRRVASHTDTEIGSSVETAASTTWKNFSMRWMFSFGDTHVCKTLRDSKFTATSVVIRVHLFVLKLHTWQVEPKFSLINADLFLPNNWIIGPTPVPDCLAQPYSDKDIILAQIRTPVWPSQLRRSAK